MTDTMLAVAVITLACATTVLVMRIQQEAKLRQQLEAMTADLVKREQAVIANLGVVTDHIQASHNALTRAQIALDQKMENLRAAGELSKLPQRRL